MYRTISSIFRQPGATTSSNSSAPDATTTVMPSQKLATTNVEVDALDGLKDRLARLQASLSDDTSSERSFPCLDEETAPLSECDIAPLMVRTLAKSHASTPGSLLPYPPANTPSTPDTPLDYMFSPRHNLAQSSTIHNVLHVPAAPPPSPVLGDLPAQELDWAAFVQKW